MRNPVSACGIVGLKPTSGLVSQRGVFPLSLTLDHVGRLTRTVTDNALMLSAIAGHDPLDPGSAASPPGHHAAGLELGVRGMRIGFIRHFHETDLPADPEIAAGLENVAATLRPWLRERPGDYGQLAQRRLLAGAFMSAGDYVQANRRRLEMIAAVEDALREVDVLLCASSMDPPSGIKDAAEIERTYPRQARTPFNVSGHPALAMMAGLSSSGLPLSVQFVGGNFAEATLFRVARAWERAAGTDEKHPPVG